MTLHRCPECGHPFLLRELLNAVLVEIKHWFRGYRCHQCNRWYTRPKFRRGKECECLPF